MQKENDKVKDCFLLLLSNALYNSYRKQLRSHIYPQQTPQAGLSLSQPRLSSIIPLHNIAKYWQCGSCHTSCIQSHPLLTHTDTVCPQQDLLTTQRADHITHLFGIPATTTDVLAVLTPSQGLEQRLDADVKEAWILLAGRHGCRGYVTTVTDSRGGTGRQDEALRAEWMRGGLREREVGSQCCGCCGCVLLSVCVFVCECTCIGKSVCVYLCQRERKRERHSASSVRDVAI